MRSLVILLLASFPALSAGPVARISCTDTFQLRGATVPAGGVTGWPLLAGDQIRTGKAPAVITFRDGSRVVLGKESRAALQQAGHSLRVRLDEGALSYQVRANSGLSVSGLALPAVPPEYEEGAIQIYQRAAYFNPTKPPLARAQGVQLTPFNLGYLGNLRNWEINTNLPPPPPPPGGITDPNQPPPSLSVYRP